jgi:hypothetical protein
MNLKTGGRKQSKKIFTQKIRAQAKKDAAKLNKKYLPKKA